MKSFILALLFAVAVSGAADEDSHDDGHEHIHEEGHGQHSCACEAVELGFDIACSNGDLLLKTLSLLEADGCSKDCSSDSCHKNFLIIQSHHDFCLHHEVPSPVEDGFHDYEGVCEECAIQRKRDPELPDCPDAVCDKRGNEAYQVLLTSNCLNNGCNSTICAENYRILRSEHDKCDHDTLSKSAESGIHDFEEICESNNCNSLLTDEDVIQELFCSMYVPTESSAHTSGVSGFLVVLAVITFLANY